MKKLTMQNFDGFCPRILYANDGETHRLEAVIWDDKVTYEISEGQEVVSRRHTLADAIVAFNEVSK